MKKSLETPRTDAVTVTTEQPHWMTAARAAVITMRREHPRGWSAAGVKECLETYLNEKLKGRPESDAALMYDFLLETAIERQLDYELAEAISGRETAGGELCA